MQLPPIPNDEADRLKALKSYDILDTAPERDFDEIVELASIICGTSISIITLIDEARQWFKAKVGTDGMGTSRNEAFCAHAIVSDEVMLVRDATKDFRFQDNPQVTGGLGVKFYAGMPLITPDGFKLGTLCVIDNKPKDLNAEQLFALQVLAKQVVKHMELRKKISELERLNDTHRKLLSVISHDLRSPLTSLYGMLELSDKFDLTPAEFKSSLPAMRQSFTAANNLLTNLLEWATSQFEHSGIQPKVLVLRDVVDYVVQGNTQLFESKKNTVQNKVATSCLVLADENMVRTILRNLIVNANKFTQQGVITISTQVVDDQVEVCVADTGAGIEHLQLKKLFVWEKRSSTIGTAGERGSGFGLLVSQQFIQQHGGKIRVTSKVAEGSQFWFTLPALNVG
jgi:signal transduction histidine kinase